MFHTDDLFQVLQYLYSQDKPVRGHGLFFNENNARWKLDHALQEARAKEVMPLVESLQSAFKPPALPVQLEIGQAFFTLISLDNIMDVFFAVGHTRWWNAEIEALYIAPEMRIAYEMVAKAYQAWPGVNPGAVVSLTPREPYPLPVGLILGLQVAGIQKERGLNGLHGLQPLAENVRLQLLEQLTISASRRGAELTDVDISMSWLWDAIKQLSVSEFRNNPQLQANQSIWAEPKIKTRDVVSTADVPDTIRL